MAMFGAIQAGGGEAVRRAYAQRQQPAVAASQTGGTVDPNAGGYTRGGAGGGGAGGGNQVGGPTGGRSTVTTALNPADQAALDRYRGLRGSALDHAGGLLRRARDVTHHSWRGGMKGAPEIRRQSTLAPYGGRRVAEGDYFSAPGNLRNAMPDSGQFGNQVNAAERATFDRAMARLRPDMERQRHALENRLVQQGLQRGSEAFTNEMGRLQRQQADQSENVALSAVGAGRQEHSRLTGLQAGLRGQEFGEGLQSAQFGASEAGRGFQQRYADQQQYQNQRNFGSQFQLGRQRDEFGRDMQRRNQFIRELEQDRDRPWMEAMRAMQFGQQASPIMTPQGPMFQQGAGQPFNFQNQGGGGVDIGGIVQGLAPVLAGIFSDRRLKSNIKRRGKFRKGINWYEFDMGGRRMLGFIADEVAKVLPAAVSRGADGWDRVNYWMVFNAVR